MNIMNESGVEMNIMSESGGKRKFRAGSLNDLSVREFAAGSPNAASVREYVSLRDRDAVERSCALSEFVLQNTNYRLPHEKTLKVDDKSGRLIMQRIKNDWSNNEQEWRQQLQSQEDFTQVRSVRNRVGYYDYFDKQTSQQVTSKEYESRYSFYLRQSRTQHCHDRSSGSSTCAASSSSSSSDSGSSSNGGTGSGGENQVPVAATTATRTPSCTPSNTPQEDSRDKENTIDMDLSSSASPARSRTPRAVLPFVYTLASGGVQGARGGKGSPSITPRGALSVVHVPANGNFAEGPGVGIGEGRTYSGLDVPAHSEGQDLDLTPPTPAM